MILKWLKEAQHQRKKAKQEMATAFPGASATGLDLSPYFLPLGTSGMGSLHKAISKATRALDGTVLV